jgi:hypothetical protein
LGLHREPRYGAVFSSVDGIYAVSSNSRLTVAGDETIERTRRLATLRRINHDVPTIVIPIDECPSRREKTSIGTPALNVATPTGAGYSTLSPTAQHDAFDIFRLAWKPPA